MTIVNFLNKDFAIVFDKTILENNPTLLVLNFFIRTPFPTILETLKSLKTSLLVCY